MKIVQNSKFKIQNFLITLFLTFYILYSIFYIHEAHALDATGTATAKSASPSGSLVDKLNALKQEIASKAANLKQTTKKKLENKAYVGVIVDKTDSKISLQTRTGLKNILLDEYTLYQNNSKVGLKKNFGLDSLEKDDYIAALGDVDDKGNLAAKKIIKENYIKFTETTAFWGQVQSTFGSTLTLKSKDNRKLTIFTDGAQFNLGSSDDASILDAKVNKFVVTIGTKVKETQLNADFVYILTHGGVIKPEKKQATTSATPSASKK